MTVTKRWLVGDLLDFDTFLNLRKSGIDITISSRPDDINVLNDNEKFKTAQVRWIEAITTTSEQETLLLLCCNKLNFIGERTY